MSTYNTQAFDMAMCEELYDDVLCHGHCVDVMRPAYACTNVAEFFAELSVAYLCKDDAVEYNRDYPFNCAQLMVHDHASFLAIEFVWLG